MKVYTIGYSGKNAEKFFQAIARENIKKVLDIRLYNTSQLAGFSKRDDLKFFLESICNCEYRHLKILAPSPELLKNYKDKKVSWEEYEIEYNQYLTSLRFNDFLSRKELNSGCFLCAEPTAEKCHRRLVAEYIQSHMDNIEIIHL